MQPKKPVVRLLNTAPVAPVNCALVPRIAARRESPSNALSVAAAFGPFFESDCRSPMIVNSGSLFDAAYARAFCLSVVKLQVTARGPVTTSVRGAADAGGRAVSPQAVRASTDAATKPAVLRWRMSINSPDQRVWRANEGAGHAVRTNHSVRR